MLWPEVKIRVWYPGEAMLDISRQALKDVSVCWLKMNTASFSLTKAVRRLNAGFCFSSTLLVPNTMPWLFPKSCTRMSSDLTENSTLRFFNTSLSGNRQPDILKWPFTRPLNEAKHDHWMRIQSVKSSAANSNQSRRMSAAVKHRFTEWRATKQNAKLSPGVGADMSNSWTIASRLQTVTNQTFYQWIGTWYICICWSYSCSASYCLTGAEIKCKKTNHWDTVWIKPPQREWKLPLHCKRSRYARTRLFSTVVCCRIS